MLVALNAEKQLNRKDAKSAKKIESHSKLNKLYRWELTNAAHPESDKATFHDYIVEHDLEKLTKEKRQGLGGNLPK